jgi:hypothetical protein
MINIIFKQINHILKYFNQTLELHYEAQDFINQILSNFSIFAILFGYYYT